MASIIKVDELRSQANGSAISIASGGAVTVNNGIADAGTISAGTLGSSVVVPASIGGSLVYLESVTGTNVSSIAFENKFSSTDYIHYVIEFQFKPTTDDRHIVGQFGYGGASTTWITSNYRTSINETYYGSSSGEHTRTDGDYAFYTTGVGGGTTDAGVNGTFYLIQPYVTGRYKLHRYNAQKWESNDHLANQSAGTIWYGGTDAITAIKFFSFDYTGVGNHGNITGEARMYGLKAS